MKIYIPFEGWSNEGHWKYDKVLSLGNINILQAIFLFIDSPLKSLFIFYKYYNIIFIKNKGEVF